MELQAKDDAGLHQTSLQIEPRGFDNDQPMDVHRYIDSPVIDDSRVVRASVKISGEKAAGGACLSDVEMKMEINTGKKRRGRPPKKKDDDEEDVCFICFDGGSLVLCDRRGCPKAYHPACIKRDEAFFLSNAKWNCGWHFCTSCEKASHFMCYLCPYSLCKRCVKDADYVGIRGNKGLCGTCMRTVMLVENNVPGNKETVDFDDKSSWEYLFKVYWVYLKEKLNLTLDELNRAENPLKGFSILVHEEESPGELSHGSGPKFFCSESSCGDLEGKNSKRRKTLNPSKSYDHGNSLIVPDHARFKGPHMLDGTEWASKELLELVEHMKNGDTSPLSRSDVHGLLLEYITINGLQNPSQECQIRCDLRLRKLFRKECVDQLEMQKLLEYHFLIKGNSPVDGAKMQFNTVNGNIETDDKNNKLPIMATEMKHETNGKHDVREPKINGDESAAVDFHNINLIYLPRNLMENLIDDDKFHEKVVGSVVRIKICSGNEVEDVHRLVQVVGTVKVAEPYKIGTRTSSVMLEILNLDKKEVISLDAISDQEFSEDECRYLLQSVISGLIKWWTVNEIKEKAMTLQALRDNDWLQKEILQVCHLRDQASENGHKKKLKEYEEKLQLLNSPEERQRRLHAIPEVHNNLNPAHCTKDGGELRDTKQDTYIRPGTGNGRKGRKLVSPRSGGDVSNDLGSKSNTNLSTRKRVIKSSRNQGRETFGLNTVKKPKTQTGSTNLVTGGRGNQAVTRSEYFSGVPSKTLLPILSTGMEQFAYNIETDIMWHYQDPTGRVQGPFPIAQLRKWSASGHFPPDLRIWKINEKQEDSILLKNVLNGHHYKELSALSNSCLPSDNNIGSSADRYKNFSSCSRDSSPIQMDNPKDARSWNLKQNDKSTVSGNKSELKMYKGLGSNSSSDSKPINVHNSDEGKQGKIMQVQEPLKGINVGPIQPSFSSSLISLVFSKPCETFSNQLEDRKDEKNYPFENDETRKFKTKAVDQMEGGQSYEKRTEKDAGQSSGQSWRPPHISSSSNGCDASSRFVSAAVSVRALEQKQEMDFPSSSANTSKGDSKNQDAESKHSSSSNVPVQISGRAWSTASSPVGGGPQFSEAVNGWGHCSHAPDKPSVEEWASKSVSSLKPTEAMRDHAATPTSGFFELGLSSPSHPASNPSSWQPIVSEVNEFSPLADDSVSNLLAEVEAMETLIGLSSPTSMMNYGGDMTLGKHNCFDFVECFSPAPDRGGDATSSTGDLLITSQSTVTDETRGSLQADVDLQKKSVTYSTPNFDLERNKRHGDVSVNQWEAGSEITDANWSSMSQHTSGNKNEGCGTGQATAGENINVGQGTSAGNEGFWGSHGDQSFHRFRI